MLSALLVLASAPAYGQAGWLAPDSAANKTRTWLVVGGTTVATAGLYGYLGAVWYSGQTRSRFHWYDDWRYWQQLDKLGHAYGAYQESRAMTRLLLWAGWKRRNAAVWGGVSGFLLQSPIEIFDGFMRDYGASSADLVFNAAGAGLCALNELLWAEQRLQLRFSYFPTDYPKKRPDLLGRSVAQQLLKDYNGQTYWLGVRLSSFLPTGKAKTIWPAWLNPAIGYSGGGMLGGYGDLDWPTVRAREYRRFFLSLQIDWEQIKTNSAGLKLLFYALNCLHVPAPALEWSSGNFRAHAMYF